MTDFQFKTADPCMYDLLKEFAKENRKNPTEAESILWKCIKSRQLGHPFRRQHIIGEYIADFANLHYKLVVEVDGKYHFKGDQPVADEQRTADLNRIK